MSTKAIRKVLRLFGATNVREDPTGEKSEALHAARAEVEAIERAAKAYAREDSSSLDDDVIDALRVMESIARDAP